MYFQDSVTRRELLRIGALSLLSAPAFGSAHAAESRDRSCIFLMLQGGPSHHDLWDPKPSASVEIRGPFQTVATNVAGTAFGELFQKTARVADRLAVIRSMTHKFTNHIAGTYITVTGSTNQPDRDREAELNDFPGPGAVLNYLGPASSVPRSVSLPNWLSIPGPSNRMPGQYGGFLGGIHDPFLISGDPNQKDFRPLSLQWPEGMTSPRIRGRLGLLDQLDDAAGQLENDLSLRYDHLRRSAYELVSDGAVRGALNLELEKPSTRDRYGRTKIGQSLLLARRLIEAGVRFVGYNELNQKWDTHGDLANRYKSIVPPLDQAYSALIEDLEQRGMLPTTMVVNAGEFGRTPVMNKGGGRDHWPNVYSIALAGGGIEGGQIYGASDSKGAEVLNNPTSPADVLATMWRHLGVAHKTEIYDQLKRPHQVSSGRVLSELL